MASPTLACIWLPELPLQLAQRRVRLPASEPLAVLQGDQQQGPQQKLGWVSPAAEQCGVVPGMALRAAQSLCLALRVEVVDGAALEAATDQVWRLLLLHSPRIEPDAAQCGILWADPSGLGAPEDWQRRLQNALQHAGWRAQVRLGFHRYFCQALLAEDAAAPPSATAAAERRAALSVGLCALQLPAALQQAFEELGLRHLGEVLRLPAADVKQRLGAAAAGWYRQLRHPPALRPVYPRPAAQVEHDIEPPTEQHGALLLQVQALLPPLLVLLQQRGEAAIGLRLQLRQVRRRRQAAVIQTVALRAAAPTQELRLWIDLLRLRLPTCRFVGPVDRLTLELQGHRQVARQATLLPLAARRDLQAAARAIRRVQAALGPASTTCAQLCAEHLPERQFVWQPTATLRLPQAAAAPRPRQLIRQGFAGAHRQSLPALQAAYGAILRWYGPYRLSQVWGEHPVERDYYYALTARDHLLWLYRDAPAANQTACWVVQGLVD